MAEWFAEGLLERLTAEGAAAAGGDAEVATLLRSAVLFIVPNMCPDGSVRCAAAVLQRMRWKICYCCCNAITSLTWGVRCCSPC
jgi:hypothetical protein